MPSRILLTSLALAVFLAGPAAVSARQQPAARERPAARPTSNAWVATVVTRITEAGGRPAAGMPGGTVTIRVRIGAEGAFEGAAVEESSGSDSLDARALEAARAASPFPPPPQGLLTLEGFTELAFPLEFGPGGG